MTTIITGASRGIGFQAARILAADTSRTLVLAGRDPDGLVRAAQRLGAGIGNAKLIPMRVDLASLASVRAFASEFHGRGLPPLEAILCNAGISLPTARKRSADGYEAMFAVNHLAHFLLVHLLLDRLQPPARIVFTSSGTQDAANTRGPMKPPRYVEALWLAHPEQDPDAPRNDREAGGQAYATSKLCNVLCAHELARRLEASGLSSAERPITVNAFAPGFVPGTGLGRSEKPMMRFAWHFLLPGMSRMMRFGRTPAQAGSDLAYLVTAPELEGVTGKYFAGREAVPSSSESYDMGKAKDLWQTSIELARLQPEESPLVPG